MIQTGGRRISSVYQAADDGGNAYVILEEAGHPEGEVRFYTTEGMPCRRLSPSVFEILAPDLLSGYRSFTVTAVQSCGDPP